MIVWLNKDGSVGEIVSSYTLTDPDGNTYSAFSQREGNVAAGGIFVYFEGGNPSGGLAYSAWTLPSGEVSPTAYQASWQEQMSIAFDKSRDLRKFKAEKDYLMQYFPFPTGLISSGGNGIYKVGVSDSVDGKTYYYGPILFTVASNSVVKETTITSTEYAELKANLDGKLDKQAGKTFVYGTDSAGTQTVIGYSASADAGSIVQRNSSGEVAGVVSTTKNGGDVVQNVWTTFQVDAGTAQLNVIGDVDGSFYASAWSTYLEGEGGYLNIDEGGVTLADDHSSALTLGHNGYAGLDIKEDGKYVGGLSFGAKSVTIETMDPINSNHIYAFQADGNATKLTDPAGTATLELGIGEASLYAYTLRLGTSAGADNYLKFNNDAVAMYGRAGVSVSAGSGSTIDLKGEVKTYLGVTMECCAACEAAPTKDAHLTNKKYVDGEIATTKTYVDATAEAQATEKANAEQSRAQDVENTLQKAIDAINASQNFVATYATKADMPTPPVSGLESKDCVLVLKDEDHQDQAYVYKYNSAGWEEVGPLGDYYTTAQIDEQHKAMETAYKAYSDANETKAETYADTASASAVKAVFTATSSSTEVSE